MTRSILVLLLLFAGVITAYAQVSPVLPPGSLPTCVSNPSPPIALSYRRGCIIDDGTIFYGNLAGIPVANSGSGATSEGDLESDLTDVSDVFTINDGFLDDDDLTDNPISNLQNVDSGVSGVDHQMIVGNGSTYQGAVLPACAIGSEKYFYNQATRTWTCETDATSATQGLGAAHNVDRIIDGAIDEANATEIGNDTDRWKFWCESGTCFQKTSTPSDKTITIPIGKFWRLYDEENDVPFLTFTPGAATPNEKFKFDPIHDPLVSAEVPLYAAGDCVVGEPESIVTGDPPDKWITCADTTDDAVSFSYKVTGKIALDVTPTITLIAVNKNTAAAGTFSLECAAQSVRTGPNDLYAAHNTTNQQPVSFTFTDTNTTCTAAGTPHTCCTGAGTGTCPSHPQEGSATFTLNGIIDKGAHIKGQCNVSAAPVQINDIRLHNTAVIELSANSLSD